jgi:hypothetical protein
MYLSEVSEKIENEDYKNKMVYPSRRQLGPTEDTSAAKEQARKELDLKRREYAQENYRLEKQFRNDLVAALGDQYDLHEDAAQAVYDYAWDQGHSSGYSEVVTYTIIIMEMVEKILKSYGVM